MPDHHYRHIQMAHLFASGVETIANWNNIWMRNHTHDLKLTVLQTKQKSTRVLRGNNIHQYMTNRCAAWHLTTFLFRPPRRLQNRFCIATNELFSVWINPRRAVQQPRLISRQIVQIVENARLAYRKHPQRTACTGWNVNRTTAATYFVAAILQHFLYGNRLASEVHARLVHNSERSIANYSFSRIETFGLVRRFFRFPSRLVLYDKSHEENMKSQCLVSLGDTFRIPHRNRIARNESGVLINMSSWPGKADKYR